MRCRFFKVCGDPGSVTCAEMGGMYYDGPIRGAGCYRERENEELRIKTPKIHHIRFKLFTQKVQEAKTVEG
jgi:hypothetical protein